MKFSGKIPVTIFPTFWLFAAIIGFLNAGGNFIGTLIWILIIFVSVLFHEFGHALTARAFGQNPRIELVALGGITYHNGEKLPFLKQFVIVFNGPLFGFLLFIFSALFLQFYPLEEGLFKESLKLFRNVNLIWTLVNLLPVMPLDGGQLLRIICEGIFGTKGIRYALLGSVIVAIAISLLLFLYQQFLFGSLFFLLAFQSYDTYRRTHLLSDEDRKEELRSALEKAENFLKTGRKKEAEAILEKIHKDSKEGIIHALSSQYLAYLKFEEGKGKEAYDLLIPIRKELSDDGLFLLHQVAFDQRDFPLVLELGGTCYQAFPTPETAVRNAEAAASLSQTDAAIGWLQTALDEGIENMKEIIGESVFDPIRDHPTFKQFSADLPK